MRISGYKHPHTIFPRCAFYAALVIALLAIALTSGCKKEEEEIPPTALPTPAASATAIPRDTPVAPSPTPAAQATPTEPDRVLLPQHPPTVVPIIYKMYDWGTDFQRLNPEWGPVGSQQFYRWDDLNPAPGVYDWSLIDRGLALEANLKVTLPDGREIPKPVILEFKAHLSGKENWEAEFYDATPTWVYDQMDAAYPGNPRPIVLGRKVGHTLTGCGRVAVLPTYESRIWQDAYYAMVRAFAQRYGNNPQVTAIIISTGLDGETSAVKDKGCSYTSYLDQMPGDIQAAFVDFVLETMSVYRKAFPNKTIYINNAPGGSYMRWLTSQHAASFTPPIGLKHSGLVADLDGHQGYGKYIGLWDMMRQYSTTLPIWVESMYDIGDREGQYWTYLAGLHYHPDGADLHSAFFTQGHPDDLRFFGRYLGVTIDNTPDVWTVLRDAEFPYQGWSSGGASGFVGDWTFWLTRSESAPQSATQRVWRQDLPVAREHRFSRQTRRTMQNLGQIYMSFDIDDRYRYVNQKPLSVSGGNVYYIVDVTILNYGTDTFALQYRNWDGALVSQVRRKGSDLGKENDWVTVSFVVRDGYFHNNMPGDVDFRISCEGDGDEYIHMVRVEGGWGEPPTPTPTRTPTRTRTPTLTLVPSLTPLPTATLAPGMPSPTPAVSATLTPYVAPTPTPVPNSVRFDVVADTFIDQWAPQKNYSTHHELVIRTGDIKASLLKFDFSGVPPHTVVDKAVLNVKVVRRSNVGYIRAGVYKVLRPWEQSQATWERASQNMLWSIAGGNDLRWDRSAVLVVEKTMTEDNAWYDLDITALVQDWINDPSSNHGLVLRAAGSVSVEYAFASSDNADKLAAPRIWMVSHEGTPLPPTATPTSVTPVPTATPVPRISPTLVTFRAGQDSVRIADTFLDSWAQDKNHQFSLILSARQSSVRMPLMYFDLTSIPSFVSVKKAVLHLYVVGRSNPHSINLSVAKVQRSWDPSQVNWNQATATEAWFAAGARDVPLDRDGRLYASQAVAQERQWTHWDVTGLVQDWVADPAGNHGLLMVAEGNVSVQYDFAASGWGAVEFRPYLEVEYIALPPTPTAAPTVVPSITPSPTATPLPRTGQYVFQQGMQGYRGSADTYVDQWNPAVSNGSQDVIVVRSGNVRHGLVRFDLSAIPTGSRITKAELSLYTLYRSNPNPLPIQVFGIAQPWNAVQATWQRASAATAWGGEGLGQARIDYIAPAETSFAATAINQWVTFSVLNLAQEWVYYPERNHGLVLKGAGTTAVEYAFISSDWGQGDALRPRLLLEWEQLPPSPTPTGPTLTPTQTRTPVPTATLTPIPTPTRVRAKLAFQQGLAGYQGVTDTFIDRWNVAANAGREGFMTVRQNNVRTALIRYDLSQVPESANVLNATLDLWIDYSSNPSTLTMRAYLIRRPWHEDGASWLQADYGKLWGSPGANAIDVDRDGTLIGQVAVSGSRKWVSLDVSEAVRHWIEHPEQNYGLALLGEGGQSVEYSFLSSQYHRVTERPKLFVDYDLAPTTGIAQGAQIVSRAVGLLVSLLALAGLIALLQRNVSQRRPRRIS